MWNMVVSIGNALAGRLMLGFADACSGHPVLVVGFFGLMLGLIVALWVEMLQVRSGPIRTAASDEAGGTGAAARSRP